MKLTDLNPRWYAIEEDGPVVGLTFDSPANNTKRIGVPFYARARAHMTESGDLLVADEPGIWSTNGKDFDEMTLTPAIDVAGWSGTVTNGEILAALADEQEPAA
jgi:hypothetical protein